MTTYTQQRAAPPVVPYVTGQLNRFRNPKAEDMVQLVRAFDKDIAGELETFCNGRIKDSIVGNRHRIAHGRASGISMEQIIRYFAMPSSSPTRCGAYC